MQMYDIFFDVQNFLHFFSNFFYAAPYAGKKKTAKGQGRTAKKK
jgi:hypothetical protein